MKRLRYKTELEEEYLVKSSSIMLTKASNKLNLNYLGFFVVYFALSLSYGYLVVYLPVYLLSILNINRNALAFIQIFTFCFLLLAPFLGFFFDKFAQHKKKIIMFCLVLFLLSFLGTLFTGSFLTFFGLLLGLNLFSHEAIKVGVDRILIDLSSNEVIKDKNLSVINIASNIGGFIPSLIFMFIVTDVFKLNLWANFFLIGGISLIPILFSVFCFDFSKSSEQHLNIETRINENKNKVYYYQIFFLTLSFIIIWSDKLFQYPFGSWIFSKYGEGGLKIFSFSYGFFLLLSVLGFLIGKRITKKAIESHIKKSVVMDSEPKKEVEYNFIIKHRRNIIIITICIYIPLEFLMVFTNLTFLMIIYGLGWFISGIMILNYVSLSISISKQLKYQNFLYQMLRFGVAIASVIFIPMGTFLSSFISTEYLILIAGFLSFFSLIPLLFIKQLNE